MAALAHFPHIALHSTHSVHDQGARELPSHDQADRRQTMEQAEEEGGGEGGGGGGTRTGTGDNLHNPHTSQPTIQQHTVAPTAPLVPSHMDSDMEGGEDTAGGVSPSPWSHLMNPDTASVQVVHVHDAPDTNAPPLFAPLSPVPPPPPPLDAPQLDGPENAYYPPPAAPQLDSPENAYYPPPPHPIPVDRRTHTHDRDEEEEDDDEDDDDERSHVSYDRAKNFYPFEQDTSVPDAEELRILESYTERSAVDDAHWMGKTFFDPQDPDLTPGDSGTINWLVTDFNGTKEKPRKDLLLRSPTVRIGGYEWRIKLLPHGNVHTDRLSLYVENVTVQSLPQEEWSEDELPLPVVGEAKVMKRKAVAAQISIVVYNPDDPRVNEFKSDAHQFHKDSPDHGWPRFSSVPWYEIHRRSYAQRQPLLRNDTLAIKAFVRVVHDPTGCMWALNESERMRESASMTGLSTFPSFENLAISPILAMWLHLRPFRNLLYALDAADLTHDSSLEDDSVNILCLLQAVLYRMRFRKFIGQASAGLVNDYIESTYAAQESHDLVQTMDNILSEMEEQLQKLASKKDALADAARSALEQLNNVFGDREAHFSGSRQTKRSIQGKSSMQEVADGLSGPLCQSEVLTIDLERQVFDSEKRCWKKLLNKVRLDDEIVVGGTPYTLYAFATHEGHLQNGRYASYFRPAGTGALWYTYTQGYASCQTRTKAVLSKEGVEPPEALEEPVGTHNHSLSYDRLLGRADAVAYVVIYVRNDVAQDSFRFAVQEPWNVPQWILDDHTTKSADQVQATNGTPAEILPYDERASREPPNVDLEMNDATTDVSNEGKASDRDVEDTSTKVTIDYLSQPFYEGQTKDGDYHGEGHLIYLDGNEYTGSFVTGSREGKGTMIYQNGDEYTGDWRSNQHHGSGTYKEKRTGNVYKGHWEEGKKNGEGTTFWKVSEEESRMCRICYCADADAAFYDCGHVVACSGCARRVEDCPVCRRMVRDVVKLYYLA